MSSFVLVPIGDHSVQHTRNTGTTNWDCVNEYPTPVDTNYVYNNNDRTAKTDIYTLSAIPTLPANTIFTSVSATARCNKIDATGTVEIVLEAGSQFVGTSYPITTSYVNYTQTWTSNPLTTLAWTSSDISNLLAGIKTNMTKIESSGRSECSQFFITVEYTIPIPPQKRRNTGIMDI
jgi:hypothetical protein